MKVYSGIGELTGKFDAGSVVTIGNFDGVHRGHQELVRTAVARARQAKVPAVVFTFEPHPLMVLKPELKLQQLFDSDDRREQLQALGVDVLVVQPFSRDFSQRAPESFVEEFLLQAFHPLAIIVGYDFSFGANRAGSIDFLRAQAARVREKKAGNYAQNFDVEVVPAFAVNLNGAPVVVSSTRIRQTLADGDTRASAELLGRPYALRGRVKKGKGRGKTIGIPTANLEPTVSCSLLPGVYSAYAVFRSRQEKAVVNIGRNPTFEHSSEEFHIEAHLPEYDGVKNGDFYGEVLELRFWSRIRDEQKFPSAAALVEQIKRDIVTGMRQLP